MPILSLTGSEIQRIDEIEDRWLVFEPVSNDTFYDSPLYSVPNGQTYGAEVVLSTGSVSSSLGTITIEKTVYIFDNDEVGAANFINQNGEDNIVFYKETIDYSRNLRLEDGKPMGAKIIEIQTVNFPNVFVSAELLNAALEKGYKVEIFLSSSLGLQEVEKQPIYNSQNQLISDTYLQYFEIEDDIID